MNIARILAVGIISTTPLTTPNQHHAITGHNLPSPTHQTLTVDTEGKPTSGMATLDTNSSFFRLATPGLPGTKTERAGGGTWTYGWELINGGTKRCFSHYIHPTNSHRATAIMGSMTDSKTARPSAWAKASVTAGITAGTCTVYWDNR